jgi:hypothetical protein
MALGMELGARASRRRAAIRRLLEIPGRLYLTSSHVDLVMSLESANTVWRRAGLDRDPGWLPAYGRVVYYHFR